MGNRLHGGNVGARMWVWVKVNARGRDDLYGGRLRSVADGLQILETWPSVGGGLWDVRTGVFDPPRENGTLRGYQQHRMIDDVLANPGEVDITASVNFTKSNAWQMRMDWRFHR